MKISGLVLAAVGVLGLSGCAVYPAGYDGYGNNGASYGANYGTTYGSYGSNNGGPYVIEQAQPVYIYGSGAYRSGSYGPTGGRSYARPGVGQGPHGGQRDQDRDGVPNRYDRDRDGDGVPNRVDSRPSNPYRR